VALPLYPQFGTEPNGFYIPPRWAPRDYLVQMFGPGVDEALARYRAPSRELLAVLQLFRTTQKIIFRFEIEEGPKVFETEIDGKPWSMYDDTVIGFDQQGREAVRVRVEEPIYQRPAPRVNSI
jgi:nitrate reductase beta subunit